MAKRPILVASDLSPRNDRAVKRAIQLGKQLGRDVVLAHAVTPAIAATGDMGLVQQAVMESLPDPDAKIAIALPVGPAPQAVVQAARDCGAELIVAGVARFNSAGDFFLGTAVDQMISRGHLPVLVVKRQPHKPYERLLVTVDYSDLSAHALIVAAKLFPDAAIDALHAYHVPYEAWQRDAHLKEEVAGLDRKAMDDFLHRPDLTSLAGRVAGHVVYGDIGSILVGQIAALSTDLVVSGTHGHGGFRRAALGSTASAMLEWISKDMLIVPPED